MNTASNTLVGQVHATDGDAAQSISYSLLSGNDSGAFSLHASNGEIRVADASKLDFETTRQFALTIQATDNGQPKRSDTATVIIDLLDVNEFDPLLDDSTFSINENSAVNTAVGQVTATDADTSQSITYTIQSGNSSGAFLVNHSTGEIRVADATKLNFEAT